MSEPVYTLSLAYSSFWYHEMMITAQYVVQNMTDDEIEDLIYSQNSYQCLTTKRMHTIYHQVMKRLRSLPQEAVKLLAEGIPSSGKCIVLLSIMRTDSLFCEFIAEVFAACLRRREYELTRRDLNSFFTHKARQSETVKNWSESSIHRLKQSYIRIMIEAGLIILDKKVWKLYLPVIDRMIKDIFVQNGMQTYLSVLSGKDT